MLERMRVILDRIDELNNRFRGMSPRRSGRAQGGFAAALHEARNAASPPTPVLGAALTPTPATAPAPVVPAALTKALDTGTGFAALIERHARANNLDPALVARLIQVESDNDPNAVSRRGAQGLMQLMPQTAEMLGVTDPFDPEQNISGGTRYLATLLSQNGGDMQRALAAYNAGPGVVSRFGGVPPFAETRNFLAKVLGPAFPTEETP